MRYGTPFDKWNPPALLFWDDGVASIGGYLLDGEREWACSALKRHKADPARWSRPAYIVKLKAWKLPEQPK